MKIKTSELTRDAFNWAVAKCEGFNNGCAIIRVRNSRVTEIIPGDYNISEVYTHYTPSTNWAQGGPIIEREGISIGAHLDGEEWFARDYWGMNEQAAENPLIAAMRCYVASKLGDAVDVPEGLC